THAIEGFYLGLEDDPVIGSGGQIITARVQAFHQRIWVGQGGQADNRNQGVASQVLDAAGRATPGQPRAENMKQGNIRSLLLVGSDSFKTVFCADYPVPFFTYNRLQNQPV